MGTSSAAFGNILIPIVLVFCIILAVFWMLGRCRYKILRRNKHNKSNSAVVTLNSGLKLEICDFIVYCCWSSNDRSADVIKYYDKINVISYENAVSDTNMDECVICKEVFDVNKQICVFKCQHCFHVLCIVKWLAEQKKCPLCWDDITAVATV